MPNNYYADAPQPTVMGHSFSRVPRAEIPRSSFDRSHGHKTTMDAGYLYPVFVDEALPGDTFRLNTTAVARLTTPLFPTMDNMFLDLHFFAVPIRLVWANFHKFFGAQDDPGDSTSFVTPKITVPGGGFTALDIFDYMGIPPGIVHTANIRADFFRAYNLIYNEWYRDQNLVDSVTVNTDDGPDAATDYALLRRGKRHDYFTSCLPWPQKGTAVNLPLGTSAPVNTAADEGEYVLVYSDAQSANRRLRDPSAGANDIQVGTTSSPGSILYADLTNATAATINQLREAFQIQKLYERDARGGTRYIEIIRSHFGVISPDMRLQRPEYLGGGSTRIQVQPVGATAEGTGTNVGDLTAIGTAIVRGNGFTQSFTEHSIVLGLASIRADLTYQQGINRMFSRSTRWDFYWPALAHIGEQPVLNQEIWADGSANDALTFGYQERYAEYRYKPSVISAQMRSDHASSLDAWHLSQDFATLPALNQAFIEENPPIDRAVIVTSEPNFRADFHFDLKCARPMPMYSVPGLIDHF